MNKLLEEHIKNSELVQASITEAVHRFWHDRVLDDKKNRWTKEETLAFKEAGQLLSNLWNLFPNWRYILLNKPKRYQAEDNTISIPSDGKPKEIINLEINLNYK